MVVRNLIEESITLTSDISMQFNIGRLTRDTTIDRIHECLSVMGLNPAFYAPHAFCCDDCYLVVFYNSPEVDIRITELNPSVVAVNELREAFRKAFM